MTPKSEVDASPTTAIIDLHIFQFPRPAAVGNSFGLDPAEDGVKFSVVHMEGVVMALELVPIVIVQGQRIVYLHRREVSGGTFIGETEDMGKPTA